MAIRVTRNDAGNCITFVGSTNPVYWNSCLSAQINEGNTNNIDVINDIRSVEEGTTVYEFFNIPYTDFQDKDGNDFDSPSACADYITLNANVVSNTGTFSFSQLDEIDAQRDSTNTTVLFSNGDIYAVNSLVATAESDGTIKVSTVRGTKTIYTGIRFYNVSINDSQITNFNTIAAAVDRLNEVLSGGAIGSDTGSTVTSTTTTPSSATFTVYGDRITETGVGTTLGYTSTSDTSSGSTNFDTSNGIYSNQVISEAGEYFEFSQDQGDWSNARGVYIGLFDETTYDVADLDVDSAGNAVKSMLYLRLKNTPFVFADSSDNGYGKIIESGFNNSPQTKETFRLGLDQDRRGYIAYEKTDGTYEVICRTATVVAEDTELRMIAIMPLANELNGIRNATVNEEVLGANYTWYYIESPDGSFYYPLFNSALFADDVDELYGTAAEDAGSSHAHTFADELPTSQTWYMPDSYMFHAQSSAPTPPAGITYNQISTGVDSDYVPSQFSQSVTVDEGDNINLQIVPAGDTATYSLTNIPAGLAFNSTNGLLQGTAPDVTQNNIDNPSDTYTITVTKANEYGSSVGSLTIVVNNLTVPAVAISGFTHISASDSLIDSDTLGEGSAVTLDDTVQDGYRIKITDAWVTANVLPFLTEANDKIFIGFTPTPTTGWGGVTGGDFNCGFRFQYQGSNTVSVTRLLGGSSSGGSVNHNYTTNLGYDFYISNKSGVCEANYNVSSVNKETELTAADGGSWTYTSSQDTSVTGSKTVAIATSDTTMDISLTGLSEHQLPAPATNLTNWTKALDFSGGNEYALQVSTSSSANAIRMQGLASLVVANPIDSSRTSGSSYARPWATAIVFRPDGNASNQHIWNLGEGAGSTDDNIYLRLDSSGNLYFGWGRSGSLNECVIGAGFNSSSATSQYWGVYVAHKGVRYSASNATAANLANIFDIRIMYYAGGDWVFAGVNGNFADSVGNRSTSTNWGRSGSSIGGRMDRTVAGNFTIGGRSGNRNFHGKVASMVITHLKLNDDMPTDAEIKLMVTDPKKWEDDYRIGQNVRRSLGTATATYNPSNLYDGYGQTQIWLMGDGTSDSYANGIRNDVYPNEQNYSKLQLNGMVSNDIETVNITGLS
jgi:hypothetical protein